MDGHTGRAAGKDGLLAGEPERHGHGVGVGHRDHLVRPDPLPRAPREVLDDALDERVTVCPATAQAIRNRTHDVRGGESLTQEPRDAAERSPRAHTCDEGVELAAARVEDLERRRRVVRTRVRRILELIGRERRELRRQTLGLSDVALRVRGLDVRARRHDLRTKRLEDAALLGRHRFRDDDDAAIAAHGTHHRQTDPCVPAARLDDRGSRGEEPPLLRVRDHRERRAVLHAPTRREVFELHDHLRAPRRNNAPQAHHGGLSDCGEDIPEDHGVAGVSVL